MWMLFSYVQKMLVWDVFVFVEILLIQFVMVVVGQKVGVFGVYCDGMEIYGWVMVLVDW